MNELQFTVAALDAPSSLELIEAVQQEYVARYGGRDITELAVAEFTPPQGIFVIGRDGGQPVACGGVRLVEAAVGELKRMYVVPTARRRGIARALLDHLETEARTLGATRLRLETGLHQPEALALYASAGYADAEPFGHYAGAPLARHLAKNLIESGVPQS
ncbi:MAG TPA: GNAT family N-acetyltransferase [Acidothermaceae bacterium]